MSSRSRRRRSRKGGREREEKAKAKRRPRTANHVWYKDKVQELAVKGEKILTANERMREKGREV